MSLTQEQKAALADYYMTFSTKAAFEEGVVDAEEVSQEDVEAFLVNIRRHVMGGVATKKI